MKYVNTTVLSANGDQSINGSQIDAQQLISASFQTIFADGTASGTVKIQMSNDICTTGNLQQNGSSPQFTVTNWSDIPNATSTVTSGAGAPITLNQLSYRWLRVVFTRVGGGASNVSCKMFAVSL